MGKVNEQNLKPITSTEQARELQKKSAKKRSQNIKEKKIIKDEILKRMKESDWDEYIDGIIARAKEGKLDAEFLRDTIGQKPKDEISIDTPTEFVITRNHED